MAAVSSHLSAHSSSSPSPSPSPAAPLPANPLAVRDRLFPSGQRKLYAPDAHVPLEETPLRVDRIQRYSVPHLAEWVDGLPRVPNVYRRTKLSPAAGGADEACGRRLEGAQFITEDQAIVADVARVPAAHHARSFVRAGIRREVVWAPGEVRAAVVTCGGLCPGLNDVVAEIAKSLHYHYGVDEVYGVRSGLSGIYDEATYGPWMRLRPAEVERIHRQGGTALGSSRGGFDLPRIMDALQRRGVNQLYVIGGDGTHRAANRIFEEARRRRLKLAVATVPKTIDNDCSVLDRSFGFQTCINESVKAIRSARVEAECAPNGIGIVKLMGRESGFIAAHATLASREVDLCLIPELPLVLDGPNGVLAHLEAVVRRRGHAVVVVAEGAGADLIGREAAGGATDASGNRKLPEVGKFIRNRVTAHFGARGVPVSIKYHDPSYMIRSVPAIASDSIFCMMLAQNAVHGAMAGFTGFSSALVNNRSVYLPITLITQTSPVKLNPLGRTFERVLSTTHQPQFRE